eukprot:CAMPEP_0178387620 /NCGR_PEP_ID=MMETSP0689_2-20121128/9167_1 /TAXON_ID=160604 /ORGANISM="Amphidinium massartii, Strain CS-259" /LENGTH=309 /DNA_ID=CAMNT_0020007989 /DNA_START=45 /DNA_END=970 /DNA_ORIENTATION=+
MHPKGAYVSLADNKFASYGLLADGPSAHKLSQPVVNTSRPRNKADHDGSGSTEDGSRQSMSAAKARALVKEAQAQMKQPSSMVPCTSKMLEEWIRACERLKNVDLAARILQGVLDGRLLADAGQSASEGLCNSLLGVFCKGGRPELAVFWFDYLYATGYEITPTMACWVICALSKHGKPQQAAQWYQFLRGQGAKPNITAYNALIAGCSKGGLGLPAALCYLRDMLEDGVMPSTITYNQLIECVMQASGKQDAAHAASELLTSLREHGIDSTAILALAWRKLSREQGHPATAPNACTTSTGPAMVLYDR